MSWSSRKKKEVIFCTFYFVNTYVLFVFYLNVQCIEYTSRICILLHLKKHYLYTFLIDFKIAGFTEEILNGNLHFLCSNYPTWKPWFIDNKTITFYVTWMFYVTELTKTSSWREKRPGLCFLFADTEFYNKRLLF